MTSTGQAEGSSQPTERHFKATLSQVEQQFKNSSLTPYAAGKHFPEYISHLEPQGFTLTTIATELRLKIYEYLFSTSATHLLRRRDGIDDENVIEKLTHTFDCNILFTCRKLYKEALPVFYAIQTFHYSFTTGGLSRTDMSSSLYAWDPESHIRQGAMPYFSKNLHLLVKLSLSLEIVSLVNNDAVLSEQIAHFAQHCPRLRTLTIHILLSGFFLPDSATGNMLRQLHPRLDKLSFIVFGFGGEPHEIIPGLRLSIADDKYWSNVCVSHQGLPGYPIRKSPWPYLTIPTMIHDYVHRACFHSKSSNFCYPIHKDDHIYEWTCHNNVNDEGQNKVNEEVRLH